MPSSFPPDEPRRPESASTAPFQARWIGRADVCLVDWRRPTLPAPLFRKAFRLKAAGTCAEAWIAGLGFYELYLNGRKVGDHVLDPPVAVYDRHWHYRRLAVGPYLREGKNVVGVMLGNGWYNCQTPDSWHFDKAAWRDYPKLIFQLTIDGAPVVVSDSSWLVCPGPVVFDSLRGGEVYDARRERDWLSPDFDPVPENAPEARGLWPPPVDGREQTWTRAAVVPGPGGVGVEACGPPCRVTETLPMPPLVPGGDVYAAPRNLAGWARISVRGPAGSSVTLRFGECLTPEGKLDTRSIRHLIGDDSFQKDAYILKGGGLERWEPRFTYHGFQYAEVAAEGGATVEAMEARSVHTDFTRHGRIATSHAALAELEADAVNSLLANAVGLPTDCPHREKNGWTSEAQLTLETMLYTFDAAPFYASFVDLMADGMRPNGQLAGIAPTSGWGYTWGNGPAWDSAYFTLPYQIHLFTGDTGILEKHFAGMLRYLDFCGSLAEDGILPYGMGDWLPPEGAPATPPELVTTAFYRYCAAVASEVAAILGRPREQARLDGLARAIRQAFNARFHDGEGGYGPGGTTASALALLFDLVEEDRREAAAERLAARVRALDGRVDYGTVGSKAVPRALLEHGMADEALRLMTQPSYPGYRHWREAFGARTFFETWEGEGSRNHAAFVDIVACMYRYFGGLRPVPGRPGPAHMLIAPMPPAGLLDFRAEYRGYASAWRREGDRLRFDITIPPGATAEVRLPGEKGIWRTTGNHVFAR